MTLLILGAILCVLIMIARELRLLRKQRETPPFAAKQRQQSTEKYKPRIFTFSRSGWTSRLEDLNHWLAILAVILIWAKFVMPMLPPKRWIIYSVTAVGVLLLAIVAEFALNIFLSSQIGSWMEKYDERVFDRVFSAEERKEMKSPYATPLEIEEMFRQKGL
jgi:hypothetical protein